MKKMMIVAALFAFAFQGFAQLNFGVKAGLNMSNVAFSYKDATQEEKTTMKMGFQIGADVEYALGESMAVETGLVFSMKGANYVLETEGVTYDGSQYLSLSYLEVPVNFVYKMKGLQLYAGPYFALAMSGKMVANYTATTSAGDMTIDAEMKLVPAFGDVDDAFLADLADDEVAGYPLDYGLNVGAGYQVGSLVVKANYGLGLGNLTPKYTYEGFVRADNKMSNTVISLTVSYMLGGE